jgi:hypothetical protein
MTQANPGQMGRLDLADRSAQGSPPIRIAFNER